MATINDEQSAAAEYVWPHFFSVPAELRLEIYKTYFSQDIYRASEVREGKFGFRFYDLLLANRQIYNEAQRVAHRQHIAQLQESQQVFCLYQKQVGVSLGSPTWSWVVSSGMTYHPKTLNADTLAALRLPMLRLSIYENQGSRSDVSEYLENLSEFCFRLRTALDKEGATRTLELHFTGQVSVTIVDDQEHHTDYIRGRLNSIGSNARVHCAMPQPTLLSGLFLW